MEAHQPSVFFSPLQRRSENPEVLHYSTTFPDKSWVGLEQNYSIARSSVRFMRSYCVWWSLEDLAICSKIGWSIMLGVSWQKSWQNSWEQPIHSGVFPAVHGWFVFVGADWNLRCERARKQVFSHFLSRIFTQKRNMISWQRFLKVFDHVVQDSSCFKKGWATYVQNVCLFI